MHYPLPTPDGSPSAGLLRRHFVSRYGANQSKSYVTGVGKNLFIGVTIKTERADT